MPFLASQANTGRKEARFAPFFSVEAPNAAAHNTTKVYAPVRRQFETIGGKICGDHQFVYDCAG